MKSIETKWKGFRFRSRTEARWAVFLAAAGIEFEYESEGVILPSGPYLPDFRLTSFPGSELPKGAPQQEVWLEIKGSDPTAEEQIKCAQLAELSKCPVLLAIGAPDFKEQVLLFDTCIDKEFSGVLPYLIGQLAFMNVGDPTSNAICVGRGPREALDAPEKDPIFRELFNSFNDVFCRVLGMEDGFLPMGRANLGLNGTLRAAYDAARSARFEFGQADERWTR